MSLAPVVATPLTTTLFVPTATTSLGLTLSARSITRGCLWRTRFGVTRLALVAVPTALVAISAATTAFAAIAPLGAWPSVS
jgi:hypothetical protein